MFRSFWFLCTQRRFACGNVGISRSVRDFQALWESFCDFHRSGISTASRCASSPIRRPCHAGVKRRVWRSMRPSSTCMKRTVQSPRAVSARPTTSPRTASLTKPGRRATGSARCLDTADLVRGVVPRLLQPRGVGPGRSDIVPRRGLLERFMRTHRIEFVPHPIKSALLGPGVAAGGLVVSSCSVR